MYISKATDIIVSILVPDHIIYIHVYVYICIFFKQAMIEHK